MLNAYLSQTESLLDDFGNVEYTQANLTTYINDARVQIAGSAECVRQIGSIDTISGAQAYQMAAISFLGAPGSGIMGALDVRMAAISGGGEITVRPWEWMWSYYIASPSSGAPKVLATYQPGTDGVFYLAPTPNAVFILFLDCIVYPVALTADSTPEVLPYPWQEAVQYYAAYLALLNAQRRTDADAMFARYQVFETRATQMTTPTRLPRQYPGRGARVAAQNMPITAGGQQQRGG